MLCDCRRNRDPRRIPRWNHAGLCLRIRVFARCSFLDGFDGSLDCWPTPPRCSRLVRNFRRLREMAKLDGRVAVTQVQQRIGWPTARKFVEGGRVTYSFTGRRQVESDKRRRSSVAMSRCAGFLSMRVFHFRSRRAYRWFKRPKGRSTSCLQTRISRESKRSTSSRPKHSTKTFNIKVRGLCFAVQKALPP